MNGFRFLRGCVQDLFDQVFWSRNPQYGSSILAHAPHNSKPTASGAETIHYYMIKQMHPSTLELVLSLFSSIWFAGHFLSSWKTAIVPLQKQGKPLSRPSSCRPIALTSCLCKAFEWVINIGLCTILKETASWINISVNFGRHFLHWVIWFVLKLLYVMFLLTECPVCQFFSNYKSVWRILAIWDYTWLVKSRSERAGAFCYYWSLKKAHVQCKIGRCAFQRLFSGDCFSIRGRLKRHYSLLLVKLNSISGSLRWGVQ